MNQAVAIFVSSNTTSKKRKTKSLKKISDFFIENDIPHEFFYTSSLFEFEMKLSEIIKKEFKKILVFGGDVSMHWLVNYMVSMNVNQAEYSLGLLSDGVVKDWLKTYTYEDQIKHVLNLVLNNTTNKQDLGIIRNEKMSPRLFLNIAGVGFNGEVIQNADRWHFLKSFSYFAALVDTFFGYKYKSCDIHFNENGFKKTLFIATVGICKYAGGSMKLCPEATPKDGLFDINIIPKMTFFEFVRAFLNLKNGRYLQNPKIQTFLSSYLKVNSSNTIHCEADGEYIGTGVFEFEIYKNDFNFYV